jgi:chemotaxis signal transduction protein
VKGLRIKEGDLTFIIKIEEVIHIANIDEIDEDLGEIKLINLSNFLNINSLNDEQEVVFVSKNKKICGIKVQKVMDVVPINNLNPFENDIFMVKFINKVVNIEGEVVYLIDSEKILEVAYE